MSDIALESPYMTTKELAAYLRKEVSAVWVMNHRGTGPKSVKVGRARLYHRDDVEAWLEAKVADDPIAQRSAAA